MPQGRPTKLTPEIQAAYLDAIEKGMPPELAADYIGIPSRTVRRWIAAGKRQKRGAFSSFLSAIRASRAKFVFTALSRIDAAGAAGDWRADQWKLQAMYPDHFNPQVTAVLKDHEKRLAVVEAAKKAAKK